MLPGRERRRFGLERALVRLIATAGVIGVGVLLGAILADNKVQGWITGLVVAAVSVVLAALLPGSSSSVQAMKELHGEAAATVPAPPDRCMALLSDIEGYPRWHPEVVRQVRVLERADTSAAQRARVDLSVPGVPLVGEVSMTLRLSVSSHQVVELTRVSHGAGDHEQFTVRWQVEPLPDGAEASAISVRLDANLSVPRLVPLGGIGDRLATGFVDAAVRALTGS